MPNRDAQKMKSQLKDMAISMNPVASVVQAAKESWLGKQVGSLMGGGNKPVSAFKNERNAFSAPRKPKRGGGGK